MLAKSEPTFWQ